jgi:mannose-6-phosphate isomerase-like protein (cupin superfamily)
LRIYERVDDSPAWICGHWNGSPVEIGLGLRSEVGSREVRHHHPYHEYYVVLEGSAVIEVNGKQIPVSSGMVVMVEPNEAHQVLSIGKEGVRWVAIKERSEPNSKFT